MNIDLRDMQHITAEILSLNLRSVEEDCRKMFGQAQREDEKNKLLPYADELETEAADELRRIKTNLGSAILLREVREPLLFWLQRLDVYMELYSMKFSKEDHVLFVLIVYDLMTTMDLPLNQLVDVHHTLRKLLSKKRLLIPGEDLTLPWRPLYDICKKVYYSSNLKQMVLGINPSVKLVFEEILADVRHYFPPSSTQEILDELRPMLCPFEAKAIKFAVQMLSLFLPLSNSPKLADSTYKLWLNEILKLWDACSNFSFAWEDNVMYLMAWLAFVNAGCIDWEEYMPMMYTKFLKVFKLPICYKKIPPTRMTKILEDRVASWIISTLGGGSKSQDYLDQLLKTLDSYCHSANSGYWASIIKSFLKKLCWFFKARLKRERFRDVFWNVKTPEDKKLTDEDITRFVTSMQNVSMHAMFSPTTFFDFTRVFYVLASLRPDMVVPPLLDRLYSTIDCVTEPHKFIASLKCVRSVARPMISGGLVSSYPDGKKHVIPLLFAVLPGIDANDHQKSIITMQFISTFLNMIPVIDCSSSCSKFEDITADEEEIANATSQFEEFVLAYMDRIFSFIENAAQENVRIENDSSDERSRVERHVLSLMRVSCTAVFGQLSYPIFMSALKKLYNYSLIKIFEREVAGYAIATLIRAFAKVNGEETYKLFIPPLASYVIEAVDNQGIENEEILDDEFLYKILLLSETVTGNPGPLLPYVPLLTNVLEKTLHLKCKEGYELSSQLLSNVMSALSSTCPVNCYEYSNNANTQNAAATTTTLPIRDWGKTVGWRNLKIDWYVPGETEISTIENIFWKFLMPEIERIDKYTNEDADLSRNEIRSLLTVLVGLFSCGYLLAPLEDEPCTESSSKIPMPTLKLNFGIKRYILMPDGSNVYKVLIEKLVRFQSKFVEKSDDTTSLILLSKIWAHLMVYDVQQESNYKDRKNVLKMWKNLYVSGLGPYYTNLRSVLIEEVVLKNYSRWQLNGVTITKTHKIAFLKLFELATSDYRSVQFVARNILQSVIMPFVDNSFVIDKIIENLRVDSVQHKEKFKSTLALLKEQPRCQKWYPLFTQSYDTLKRILPAIVTSMPSEEPSVIKIMDELSDATFNLQWHLTLRLRIPEKLAEKAKTFWLNGDLLRVMPSDDEINEAKTKLTIENEKHAKDYQDLISSLLEAIHTKNLQWRYEVMAAAFIAMLLLPDEPCPVEVVRYYLHILVNDLLVLRKIAIKSIICIMKLDKTKTVRERVDPFEITKMTNEIDVNVRPGPRADNSWCLYDSKNIPKNENEWNEVRYSYNCHLGFYDWPKELRLHSSPTKQPINTISIEQMSDIGKAVDVFFSNKSNVDKFMEYMCLEEHKGESLQCYNIVIFKYLFKIYGDRYFDAFSSYLENYLQKNEDNYQRCAAEMMAGIIQGTKLWPYEKCQKITVWCMPLLRKALDTMTVETQKHWGSAVATILLRCDVNKNNSLIELLLEDPIRGDAAFKDCGRLYALQSGILHTWRLPKFWNRLLEFIKPHLANRYQNIRERLGSVLFSIFETDIDTFGWNRTLSPHVSDFVDYLLPKLEILYKIAPTSNDVKNGDVGTIVYNDAERNIPPDEAEVEEAILLLKTVSKWCANSAQRSVYPLKPDFLKLFPLFCYMENYDKDEELKKSCKYTLSVMSCSIVLLRDIPVFISAFEKVSTSGSWSARCTVLDFLQIFAFHNLFLVTSRDEWVDEIMTIVLRLLEDVRCEVRTKAGEVIGGFVHHGIIENTTPLLERFKKMSRTSLKKKSNVNVRHAGVIGLCSFINAFPYTVPPEIPPLFPEIELHLNDPEPIPSTIRKTVGNFKRTHYANWEESKQQFTADQLDIFTDIIIPPNHYA